MSAIILKLNKQFNAIHMTVAEGYELPSEDRAVLKELHMQWHKRDHYWYTPYTPEKFEILKMTFKGAYRQTKSSAKTESEIRSAIAQAAKQPQAPVKVTKTKPAKQAPAKPAPAKASPKPKAKPAKQAPAPATPSPREALMAAIAALTAVAEAL